MEATRSRKSFRIAAALALSIAASPALVNADPQSLSSVNQVKPAKKSIKNSKGEFERLVQMLLQRGADGKIGGNLAPVIGLERASPTKAQDVAVSETEAGLDARSCFVVLAERDGASDAPRPMCLYVRRSKRTPNDQTSRYFKVNLFGKLEKAVVTQGKLDATGHGVGGSGTKTELDIDAPEVKQEFDAEMSFWLKDWLKKEQKAAAKKAAPAKI